MTLPVKLYCKADEIGQPNHKGWFLVEGHTFLQEALDRARTLANKGLHVRIVSHICPTMPLTWHYGPEDGPIPSVSRQVQEAGQEAEREHRGVNS